MSLACPRFGGQRLIKCAQMPRPDVARMCVKVLQGVRLIKQERRQAPVTLAKIAGGTGRHYVAAGVIAAAHLRLHMIHRQRLDRILLAAVDAPVVVAGKDFGALHDG
jgi:hypothetical protein